MASHRESLHRYPGALIIGIGSWCILYCNYSKEPQNGTVVVIIEASMFIPSWRFLFKV